MSEGSKAVLRLQLAKRDDIPRIKALQTLAISELQRAYLSAEQIEASRSAMGLDTQLIEDGTYYCVFENGTLTGCGGWSFRSTLYGGNHSARRNARELDPIRDRARIRAMYTHPDHVRRGIGRMILDASEAAASARGFSDLEMAATAAGRPFYESCGYTIESEFVDNEGGVAVPLFCMIKSL